MACRYSAGILPYAIVNRDMYFLIGKDVRDNTWSDFGGKCEEEDGGIPLETATREFYEETCGVIMDLKSLKNRLGVPSNYEMLESRTQNGYPYYMYLFEVPYNDSYRSVFRKLLYFMKYKKIHKKFMEKIDIQWISLASVLGKRVILRNVFEATVNKHLEKISSIGAAASNNPDLFPTETS